MPTSPSFTKYKGAEVSSSNTCAFDSLFQLTCAAAWQSTELQNYMKQIQHENR